MKLLAEEKSLGGEDIRLRFELLLYVYWEPEQRTAVEEFSLPREKLMSHFVK